MKKIIFFFLILLLFITTFSHVKAEIEKSLIELIEQSYLPSEKKKEFLTRLFKLLTVKEPFSKSFEYKKHSGTLNHFFKEPIYRKLTGNIFLGYSYIENGFYFKGNTLNIDRQISTKNIDVKYLRFYRNRFSFILDKFGYRFSTGKGKSDYSFGFCLVSIFDVEDKISQKGLTLEFYLKNNATGKCFFLRTSTGSKRGLSHAIDVSIRRIVVYLNTLKRDMKNSKAPVKIKKK